MNDQETILIVQKFNTRGLALQKNKTNVRGHQGDDIAQLTRLMLHINGQLVIVVVVRVQQQGHLGPFSHRQCHVLLLQADVVAQKKAATGKVELLGFV